MSRSSLAAALLIAAAACGGNAATPDGGSTDAPPDSSGSGSGSATGFPACHELDAVPLTVPVHVTGTLSGADLVAPSGCATSEAAFGVESAGPDSVVPLRGLVIGQTYVVRLRGPADLGFYVIEGCSTAAGPSTAECLLFEDQSAGTTEVGEFVATAAQAFVVVDFYASSVPADGSFALDVYPRECADASACGGGTPACIDGACVACATSFDCTLASAPVCDDSTHACGAGAEACASDDAHDPADDGPAGATPIVLDGSGAGSAGGKICSAANEIDFLAFDVTSVGETWELDLAWTGARDLDLAVLDARGELLGLSFYEQPETAKLTFLPPGRYYVTVSEFSTTAETSPVDYTLTVHRTLGPGCVTSADCAAEFRNQLYRGACSAGSCVPIDGAGGVAEGGACDRVSDCAAGLSCPSFFFVAGADTRETCTRGCQGDADCVPLGSDFVCTTYLAENFCVEKCTDDLECPTAPDVQPASPPWFRLTCDPSGRCLP